jgi:hypothetical protein
VLEVFEACDGVDAIRADSLASFQLETFEIGTECRKSLDCLVVKCSVEPL